MYKYETIVFAFVPLDGVVVGHLYSVQYKSIFGAPNRVRRDMCEEARPSRLDFQGDEEIRT